MKQAFCHRDGDPYKSGISWLAFGVPIDQQNQTALPVAVRCHSLGPTRDDAPCHLLAGFELMMARMEAIRQHRTGTSVMVSADSTVPTVVSLGWGSPRVNYQAGSISKHGKCLRGPERGEERNGAMVELWDCDDFTHGHRFQFDSDGRIRYAFEAFDGLDDNFCLDVPGGNLVEGQTVWLWECVDGLATQQWGHDHDGAAIFLNDGESDAYWCLQFPQGNENGDWPDGDVPVIAPCDGSFWQQWMGCRESTGCESTHGDMPTPLML